MENRPHYQSLQAEMLADLQIPNEGEGYRLRDGDTIVTLDVQYEGDIGCVALDIVEWGTDRTELFLAKIPVEFPYEPGYFAFREGPVLLGALEKWLDLVGNKPALLVIDGHGTAHPRKMGLASWLGIKVGVPTIGVAKEPLLKQPFELGEEVGAQCKVDLNGEWVGTVLRTRSGVKPVYVSPGHLVNQSGAVEIAMALRGEYRILEPIRRADQAARQLARGEVEPSNAIWRPELIPSSRYDKIGTGYNEARPADPYLASRLHHHLAPEEGKHYLDIGCGTGNYTTALYNKGVRLTGIDPSTQMLEHARSKPVDIEFHQGEAEALPFADESFDGALATLTIHHWKDFAKGFQEVNRVLKPGSRFVVFHATPAQMEGYWLNHYFPVIMERSNRAMHTEEKVMAAFEGAGFEHIGTEPYDVQPDLKDLFFYSGKHVPERYFEPNFRRSISSFSAFAHAEEVEAGLARLRQDLDSGQWKEVCRQYQHDLGDYVYYITRKR